MSSLEQSQAAGPDPYRGASYEDDEQAKYLQQWRAGERRRVDSALVLLLGALLLAGLIVLVVVLTQG